MRHDKERTWTPRKKDVEQHYVVGRHVKVKGIETEWLRAQFQRFIDKIEQAAYKRGFEEGRASYDRA